MSEEVKQEGEFKMKKKPKKLSQTKDNTTVVDFKKQEEEAIEKKEKETEDAVQKSSAEKVDVDATSGDGEKVGETHTEKQEATEEVEKETVVIEATEEPEVEEKEEEKQEDIKTEAPQQQLPENIEKLVQFMEETGGTVEDYVRLNADYSKLDSDSLLMEYYKATKPHLSFDEIEWLIEENFDWDEDEDDDKTITQKEIALKEEVAKAKGFLESTKKKYYDEIKLKPSENSNEVKKAMDFFNRYNVEQDVNKKRFGRFQQGTDSYFNNFEGFDFDLGDKNIKYKLNNTENTAKAQSDLNNLVKKFLNKDGEVSDFNGYHKAIYAARNPDSLARHFYEQGKADGIKGVMGKSANVDNAAKPNPGEITFNGYKVRAISGDDSSKLKIKKYKK